MSTSWRDIAKRSITQALFQAQSEGIDLLQNLSDEQKKRVKDLVNNAYPFGMKQYTPYKVWLEERKTVFLRLGIYKSKPLKGSTLPFSEVK